MRGIGRRSGIILLVDFTFFVCLGVVWGRTMALMEFPLGPVMETHAPHDAAVSHWSTESAVPKTLEGRV